MKSGITRRELARGAAWSVPAIAAAIAAPAAAATVFTNYRIVGSCGLPGNGNIGFLLTASPTVDLSIGTAISLSAGQEMAPWTVTGVTVEQFDDGFTPAFVLTSALPAGATMELRSQYNASTNDGLSVVAIANPAPGYDATDAIPIAIVDDTGGTCLVVEV